MRISAEEELLIAGCLDREPEALRRLAERYGRPLFGFLRAFSGGDEIWTRRTVVKALSATLLHLKPFEERTPFLADVMTRLTPELQSFVPRKKPGPGPLTEDPLEPRTTVILKALASLSWKDRAFLLFRDQIGFSLEEIALIFHTRSDGLKAQLNNVRILFHEQLEKILNASPAKRA